VPAWAAVEVPSGMLEARAEEVGHQFRADPAGHDALFDPGFLKAVPSVRLNDIFTRMYNDLGGVSRTRRLVVGNAKRGRFEYVFKKGFSVKADLAIADEPPYRLVGLVLGNPVPEAADLAGVAAGFAALPTPRRLQPTQRPTRWIRAPVGSTGPPEPGRQLQGLRVIAPQR
jgi:hypothetical protein